MELTKKKIVNVLRNQYLQKTGNQINEDKEQRQCVEMQRKEKNHNSLIQSKPKQKTYPGWENTETHFTMLKMSAEI